MYTRHSTASSPSGIDVYSTVAAFMGEFRITARGRLRAKSMSTPSWVTLTLPGHSCEYDITSITVMPDEYITLNST